jgi:hypothetical protein
MSKLNDPIALLSVLQTALAAATLSVCSAAGDDELSFVTRGVACVGLGLATVSVMGLKWALIRQSREDGEYSDKKLACSVVTDLVSSLVPFVSSVPGRWTRLAVNQLVCSAVT